MADHVSNERGFFDIWTKLPLTWLTGLLGVVYGVGFAIDWWKAGSSMVWIGAVALAVCFVGSLIQAALASRRA